MALTDGVPSIRLEGDKKRALALIPEGQLLLAKAQAVVKNVELPTFSMNRRVSEDEYIYVLVANGQNIIYISAGAHVPDTVVEQEPDDIADPTKHPDFLSGMVLNGTISVRIAVAANGSSIPYKIIRNWVPTPACADYQGLNRGQQVSKRLAVEPYTSFEEWRSPNPGVEYSQYNVPRASQWSGTMAKVVQVCMGFGWIRSNNLRDPKDPKTTKYMEEVKQYGVQIRFDYKFMRTHGIYRGPDGRLWLIEISAMRGVVAMLLPIYPGSRTAGFRERAENRNDMAMVAALDDFGCLPTGEAFPTSPSKYQQKVLSGDILILMPPSALSNFYGRLSGFSSICGWSFTESGHEAHNVGYYYPDGGDGYQRSCWYQISINISAVNTQRLNGEPVAYGSAGLRLQQEGLLYSPPGPKSFIPVKYHEPMLDPPGLLSHSAKPFYEGSLERDCDSPVYVGIVDGELKVARFFRAGNRMSVNIREDERDGVECLFIGSWEWYSETGDRSLPTMPYTNDIDARQVQTATVSKGRMISTPAGYTPAVGIEYITNPPYVNVQRSRIFSTYITTEVHGGEIRTACFVNPGYMRDGYYFFEGRAYGNRSGSETMDFNQGILDPNQGVSWALIGGRPSHPPIGPQCSGMNCGGTHTDPRIMCTHYVSDICSEYADSGPWLTQCQSSFTFRGSGIRGPGYTRLWDLGRDFTGTWNFVGTGGGMASGPVAEELHEYAMKPSPDPDTGEVQQLYALRSAIGEPCVLYTKGFSATLVVTGYTPVETMGTFIGVNKP